MGKIIKKALLFFFFILQLMNHISQAVCHGIEVLAKLANFIIAFYLYLLVKISL
ncbi:hypothetical protein SDC9_180300 [bioreactor metagenome]|uniref:Uncharacterized protein n=1 Tax=bioreactor metagenome TaxID=1076179 RepID=A0A645H485_9ZZZZ